MWGKGELKPADPLLFAVHLRDDPPQRRRFVLAERSDLVADTSFAHGADLIDGDDFRSQLVALGVCIPDGACPETCARMARLKHEKVGIAGLEALVADLERQREVMLPSVRNALEQILVPSMGGGAAR